VIYHGTGTLTLRSTGHLPKGMNVRFSGLTMMVSAANGVDPDTYCVDYEFDDDSGDGGTSEDCSIIVGPPGGGGGGMPPTVPAPVIDSVTSPDGHQPATTIAGVPSHITIQGRNFGTTPTNLVYYLDGWSPTNSSAPFWPPNAISASYSIVSWSDTSINADITLPAVASGLWRIQVGFHGYISDYDATHPSTGLLQVFDATPTVDPGRVTASNGTYTIQGQHFGPNPGSLILCATSTPTCTQTTPDISLGRITSWTDVLITVALTPQLIHSQSYCVRVISLGQNGSQFQVAPNSASTNISECGGNIEETPQVVAMKLEQVGPTVISADGKYSEDTTILVTAVDFNTGAAIPGFVGTVNIAEIPGPDGRTIYS
jgi:hypothetical protein